MEEKEPDEINPGLLIKENPLLFDCAHSISRNPQVKDTGSTLRYFNRKISGCSYSYTIRVLSAEKISGIVFEVLS